MIKEKELVVFKKKISIVADKVNELIIKSDDDMKIAVEMLSQMNNYADSVKDKKNLLTKPLNEALKNARAMFAPVEEVYEGAIEMLRDKMSKYQTDITRARHDAELKIANRVKEGKGGLSVDTAVRKIAELKTVEKEVATNAGLVQFRETKILKIIDPLLIPREYLVIDESKLLKDMKAGKTVLGAELETVQVPVNYR